jgi:signal transduction histidine kinase
MKRDVSNSNAKTSCISNNGTCCDASLRAIFDTTDTIYVLLDTKLQILSYNVRAKYFAKNELHHSIRNSDYFLDYFPFDKRQILLNHMAAALRGGNVKYEVPYLQPDNTSNWYHVRIFPISGEDAHIERIMFAVTDITEKKRFEEQLTSRKIQEQKNIVKAVLKAQEIERNKLSLELHDNVNQILVSVRLYIDAIENNPLILRELVANATAHIDLAISEIRSLAKKQVVPLKGFNLKESIDELLIEMNERTDIVFASIMPNDLTVDNDLKLNIYRIVQEQVMNIFKHAWSSAATVAIREVEGALMINISDNGKGFNPLVRRKGIGITNMINRVESYNGTVLIKSNPGQGCSIEIRIPTSSYS